MPVRGFPAKTAAVPREDVAKDLAVDLDSTIVIAVGNGLQQMRYLGEGTPQAVFGEVLLVLAALGSGIELGCHEVKTRDTNDGYNGNFEGDENIV